MTENTFQKRATVCGNYGDLEFSEAINLLREADYRITTSPVGGIPVEVRVWPTSNRIDAKRLGLVQLKKFLNGEKIPRSMWTIV